jgi:hypothetical protein
MRKLYAFAASMLVFSMAQAAEITFRVDMNNESVSPNGVHLAGSFGADGYAQWEPGTIAMTDGDADGIYEVTLTLNGSYYEYKFINGNDWGNSEDVPPTCQVEVVGNDNRFLNVDGNASVLTCFASCAACGDFTVRFRVDMSQEDAVNPIGVHVAGNFQGWNPGGTMLNQVGASSVYEVIYSFAAEGPTYDLVYKYINGNDWIYPNENIPAECGDGTGNRVFTLTSLNTVMDAVCYNSCTTCVAPTSVTFNVDMSNETVSPNGVHIAGDFQGWNPGADALTDVDADNIYSITLLIQPGTYQYKFINGNNWDGENNFNESPPSECNVNNNRQIIVEGEEMSITYCYNQCSETCTQYPDPAEITFRVNLEEAGASADGVWLIGNFTSPQWQSGATEMTDTDADLIYEATVLVSGPAEILYKFMNGDVFVNTNEEAAGIASCGIPNGLGGYNRVHTRSGAPETLAVQCFDACVDCGVGIEENLAVSDFNLYPNPVENVLNVNFTHNGNNNLVFNVLNTLGQVVMTEQLNNISGSVNHTLHLERLDAGVYTLQVISGYQSVNKHFMVK